MWYFSKCMPYQLKAYQLDETNIVIANSRQTIHSLLTLVGIRYQGPRLAVISSAGAGRSWSFVVLSCSPTVLHLRRQCLEDVSSGTGLPLMVSSSVCSSIFCLWLSTWNHPKRGPLFVGWEQSIGDPRAGPVVDCLICLASWASWKFWTVEWFRATTAD